MDKKRVLKQFQWFEVQTKVRQILSEVLEPLQKRVISNSTAIGKIQKGASEEKQKVEYLTKMVSNDPQIFQHGIFATIESKFQDCQLNIKQVESKLALTQDFINNKMTLIDRQMKEASDTLGSIGQFKQYVKGQLSSQSDKLVRSSDNIFTNFDRINEDIAGLKMELNNCNHKCEGIGKITKQVEDLVAKNGDILNEQVGKFEEKLKQMKLQLDLNGGDIAHLLEQIKRVGRFEKYTKKLQQKINDISIEAKNLQYKVEVIHPMVTLAQINDYAHHILPPALRNNISVHFYNTYRKMAQSVSEHEFDYEKIAPSKKENLTLIKEVHQKATKTVFKLKKRHFSEQGIDLDELTHDKRQQLLEKLELKQEFGQMDEIFGDGSPKKNKPMEADEIAKQMSKEKEVWLAQLREKITLQLNDSKVYLVQMEDSLRKEVQLVDKAIKNCLKACQNLQLSGQLQQKYIKQVEVSCSNSIKDMQKDMKMFESCLKTNQDALMALHHIQRQDQEDRKQIVLLGMKEQHRDQIKDMRETLRGRDRSLSIDLKKQCLSCSGNPNYYNQFFKMACLNYNSSPVPFNNQTYERIALLNKIQKELQQSAKSLIALRQRQKSKEIPGSKESEKASKKLDRYESSEIFAVPERDTKSATRQAVRNFSVSQDALRKKDNATPRILNSKDLAEEYMSKNRSKIYSRRKESGFREHMARKESRDKDQTQHMIRVSSLFKDLKRQNKQFVQ